MANDRIRLARVALDSDTQAALALERHLLGDGHLGQGFECALDMALAVLPERVCWELACDFAQRVLPVWEQAVREDRRPHGAVQARRLWLAGRFGDDCLLWAHGCGCAAADAVLDHRQLHAAACAAFVVADPASSALSAAIFAAYAAYDALGAAERCWQTGRVRETLAGLLATS